MARLIGLFIALLALLAVASVSAQTATAPAVTLRAQGSTYVQQILATGPFNNWANNFHQSSRTLVSLQYTASGSTMGQNVVLNRTADFGVSDAPLTVAQQQSVNATIVHVPLVLGGVEVIYNIPALIRANNRLNLTSNVLAAIFQGTIKNWNDSAILALNPGFNWSAPILPVVRSEGSGVTFVFSQYLQDAASGWNLGSATMLNWTGTGVQQAAGNNAEITYVTQNVGALTFAPFGLAPSMGSAALQNADGYWLNITPASILAAANSFSNGAGLPNGADSWIDVDLTNQPGTNSWPIVTFSYAIFYHNLTNTGPAGSALVAFMQYINSDAAQNIAPTQNYVALPRFVRNTNTITLREVLLNSTYNPAMYWRSTSVPSPSTTRSRSPSISASPSPSMGAYIAPAGGESRKGIAASLGLLLLLIGLVCLVVGYHAYIAFKP